MRCVAIIQTERPDLDTVIVWDDNGRLVAFAYQDGQVKRTRPLEAATFEDGIAEVRDGFQITGGQATRVAEWANIGARTEPVAQARARW